MTRFILIILLGIYTQMILPVHELAKLPELFSHFQEHRTQSKDFNFLEFIRQHYFSGNPVDADYAKDQRLPFRDGDTCCLHSGISFVEKLMVLEAAHPEPFELDAIHTAHPVLNYSHQCFDLIWQPPRTV